MKVRAEKLQHLNDRPRSINYHSSEGNFDNNAGESTFFKINRLKDLDRSVIKPANSLKHDGSNLVPKSVIDKKKPLLYLNNVQPDHRDAVGHFFNHEKIEKADKVMSATAPNFFKKGSEPALVPLDPHREQARKPPA